MDIYTCTLLHRTPIQMMKQMGSLPVSSMTPRLMVCVCQCVGHCVSVTCVLTICQCVAVCALVAAVLYSVHSFTVTLLCAFLQTGPLRVVN